MGNKQSMGNKGRPPVEGKDVVKVLVGIASITPIGKALLKVSVGIADKTDHGAATKYLGKTNSTLDMVPGGYLAQQVASVATNGKSNTVLAKYDPKSAVIHKATSTLVHGVPTKNVRPSLLHH